MATDAPNVGELVPDGERRRDAIHVAVIPAVACHKLRPGQKVGIWSFDSGEPHCNDYVPYGPVGVVDPFLKDDVQGGQRFWLFLYPNTVTSLRHFWAHPAFTAAKPTTPDGRIVPQGGSSTAPKQERTDAHVE